MRCVGKYRNEHRIPSLTELGPPWGKTRGHMLSDDASNLYDHLPALPVPAPKHRKIPTPALRIGANNPAPWITQLSTPLSITYLAPPPLCWGGVDIQYDIVDTQGAKKKYSGHPRPSQAAFRALL